MITSMERSTDPGPRGGPVLQDSVTEAITNAFFEELAAVGYGRLSMEAVARRAGSGKAAIYRRWPSKEAMTADLVGQVSVRAADTLDTGTLRGDVLAFLTATDEALRHPLVSRILPDLLASAAYHPAIAAVLGDEIGTARRRKVGAILRRAVERGELPESADIELGLDFMAGPLYWGTAIRSAPADPGRLERLTDMIIAALAA
ncbi:TetR/AcrR family transcriptional regulator [Nonomuraea sp. SMC257]|uniref:TetR/AcrR family transcriptional regulator n=2 Tax=Nonomuraea montanisoli TaxID=2741721 RepID=A0A7Y6M4E6_9ACTN|nr:TetR/AcrR family transcriptional regulator [Nonomuraea montanisoli]